jgi:ubiquinone/menaquinone biosynthesis C-methylase UbiE
MPPEDPPAESHDDQIDEAHDDPIAEAAYDEVAGTYDDEVADNPYNADLEMPGTTSLVPEVDGDRVLDAGCGTGIYTEWLLARGADEVVGVDVSAEMLDRARERVGERATFHRADLGDPLEFLDDEAFDGVVSALAVDYVADWHQVFGEFARVLRPGGFVVFSVGHPIEKFADEAAAGNYFERERLVKDWDVEVPYYRRPLAGMIEPLLANGLRLDGLVEPQPTERFREKMPGRYEKESRQPVFLCLRAVKE